MKNMSILCRGGEGSHPSLIAKSAICFRLLLIALISFFAVGSVSAQFDNPRTTQSGYYKVVMIGASSVVQTKVAGCAPEDEPNNSYKEYLAYTTKTGGTTTTSSQSWSSSTVDESIVPVGCATVKKAYLYWGGSRGSSTENYWNNTVYITGPDGVERTVTRTAYGQTPGSSSGDGKPYWAMADVSSLLEGQTSGTFAVRGVSAYIDDSKCGGAAGWCLVLLYEDESYPYTQFSLFDGADALGTECNTDNKEVTVNFSPITAGVIYGSVGMAAIDGDVGSKTDEVTITTAGGGTTKVTNVNDLRAVSDFFASNMSYNGQFINHYPECINTLGFDAHHVDLPAGAIALGDNSAKLKIKSKDSYVAPFMAYVAVRSEVPHLRITKTPSATSVVPDQPIKYFVELKNEGGKPTAATGTKYTKVFDELDYNLNFVTGSVKYSIDGGAQVTVPAGNVNFNTGTRMLTISNLPSIPAGKSMILSYSVTLKNAGRGDLWRSECNQTVWNRAYANYYDQDRNGVFEAYSGERGCGHGEYTKIPVIADFDSYSVSDITHNVTENNGSSSTVAYLQEVLKKELGENYSVDGLDGVTPFSYYTNEAGTTPVTGTLNINEGASKVYYAIRSVKTLAAKEAENGACSEKIKITLIRKPCNLTSATIDVTHATCVGNTDGTISMLNVATAQKNVAADTYSFSLVNGSFTDASLVTGADIISTYNTANETSHTFTGLAAGTYSVMFTDGLGCKRVQPGTIEDPAPMQVEIPTPATACVGSRIQFVANASGGMPGTGYRYVWERSANGSVYTEDPTQTGNTYDVTSNQTNVYVKVTAYSTAAECLNAVCSTSQTAIATLSLKPDLAEIADKTSCAGDQITITAVDNASATIASRTWEKSTDDGATWTAMAQTTASITDSPIETTLYRTTWTSTGGCDDFTTAKVIITEKPSVSDKTYTICSGTPFTFAPETGDNVPDGTVYTWSVTQTTGVTGASACTNVDALSQTLSNSTAADGTATYTVTPSLPGGCDGDPFTVTVTVKPIPYLTDKTYTICSGTAFTLEPKTGDIVPTGTKYSWAVENNANVTGWSAQVAPMATMSQTLTNTSEVQQVVNYTVTPTYSITTPALTCTGDPFAVAVTVNAVPTVDYAVPTGDVCPGSTVTLIATPAHGVEPYSYAWTGATAHTADHSMADVTASTNCTGTVNVSLKVTDAAGCESLPVAKVVTTKDETAPVIDGTIAAQAPVATGAACVFNYPDVRELVRAISTDACTANADLTVTQSPEQGTPIADVTVENTITVTVKDACNKSETYDVTVSSIEPLTFSPADPAPVCAPNTVDLATTYTAEAGFTYTYHSDVAGTIAIASPVVSASNTYYIKKTQTATGCFIVKPVIVKIKDKPVVTVTPAAAECATESIDLTATVSTTAANPSWTYFTDAAGTTPASVTTITWDATAPDQTADQTTTIYAVATSDGCVSDPTATTATLKHKPAAPGVLSITACPKTTSEMKTWASLVTTTEGGATLTWYDGATVVTPADFDLSVALTKSYDVTQTVNGCESEKATVSVVISNTPTDPDVADLVQCVQASGAPVEWSSLVTTAGTQTWYETSASATPFTPSDIDVTAASTATYYVTVTDGSGCISNKVPVTATIKANPTLTDIVATPVKCKGDNNGAISVTSNGTSFAWTKGGAADASLTGASISGLEPATYTVTATLDGCTTTSNNIVVTEPDALTLTQTSLTPAACYGGEGSVTVEAQGGNGGYQYTWNDPESKTGATVSLKKGDYIVTVEDAKGCTKTLDVSMTQPDQVTAEAGDAISEGPICSDETTTVTLGATAPATGLTGAWTTVSAPAGVTPVFADAASATSSVSGLKPGEYTLRWTVTRAPGGEGCEAYDDVVVTIAEDTEKPTFALSATTAAATAAGNCVFKVPDLSGLVSNKSDNYSAAADITISQNPAAGTTITAATTVEITVTDKCGNVSDAQTVTVSVPAAVVATVTGTEKAICNGSETGSISVDVSGGTSPYTYAWTKNTVAIAQTTEDLANVGAGDYVLTVTDADGCKKTASATVGQASVITGGATPTETSSPIATDGKVTVTSTTGGYDGAGVTYQFALKQGGAVAAAYQSGTEFTGLAAGTYEVWAKNYKDGLTFDCEYKIDEVTIIAPSNIESTITQVPVKCYGEGTGSVVVTVTDGGTEPYRLQLEKTDGTVVVAYDAAVAKNTAFTFANRLAGSYVVKVKDASDYEATLGSITVTQPAAALSAEITNIVNVKCHGASTGSLKVTVTGGTEGAGYQYSWTGSTSTTDVADNLPASDDFYVVTVTDANNCSTTAQAKITEPTAIQITNLVPTEISCNGGNDGTITPTVSGGVAPYAYSWKDASAAEVSTSEVASGLAAGDYTLTVTDANNCPMTSTAVTVPQASVITGTPTGTNLTTPISVDGKVTVTSTAGGYTGAGYVYELRQGATVVAAYQSGTEFTGLAAGTYQVWVKNTKDAMTFNCEYNLGDVILSAPSAIQGNIAQTAVKCFGDNTGKITASVTNGGTAPYRLQLMKSDNTVVEDYGTAIAAGVDYVFENLSAGAYKINVKDASDYEATLGSMTVTQPTAALSAEIKAADIVNVKCHGGNTGSLTVTATGGTTDYTYSWTGSTSVAAQAPDLTAGDYTVTVTDANNCTATANATVTEPEAISISSLVPTEISCNGGNDGTITPTVSGGVAPYAYSWKDASAAEVSTSEVASGLAAGDYTLTVTDANNCPMTSTAVTVPQASVITGTPTGTNLTTPISVDGKVTVTSTAGGYTGAGYVYELRQGATVVAAYQSGTEFTGLAAGTYQVWVKNTKDAMTFNCEYNLGDVILSAPSAIQGNIAQTAVKCFGDNTGKITASVTNGGTAPYRLQLMKSDNTVVEDYGTAIAAGVDYVFENLSAGAYKINVKDASDYEATLGSMTVTQPTAALSAEIKAADIVNVKCHGGNTGSLTVTATGGTTDYTYSWTGSTSVAAQAPDLTAGDYTVTVTDANNCTATANATVTEPAALTIGDKTYTICSGEPFTMETGGTDVVLANTKYTWTVAANDDVTGKSPEGTATETMSQTLTNTSADVQTVVYTVSPEADGCHGADFTVTVTVNPKAKIADQIYTICTGEAVPFATVAADVVPANTKYSWTIATDNANVTGKSAGTAQDAFAQTLTNATATAQTVVYTVTPKSGDCVGDNFTVTVTVNPKATIAAQTYTICTGDAVPFATATNDVVPAGTKYTWTIATDNANVSGQSAETTTPQDAFAQTLTNATATAQTLTYTVTPMSGTCQGDDFTVEVTVNPKATIGNKTYTICTGEAFPFATETGDVVPTGTTYTWTVSDNANVNGQSAQSAQSTVSQTLTNATATAQDVVYTVTPKSGDCTGAAFTVTVTVNPKPAIANKEYTICTGNPFTLATVAADVVPANTKYTWTVAENNNVTGQSEQTTAADAMSQTLVNGTDVPQDVVYTVTPAGDCTGAPFTVTVTVNPMPAISNKTYTICSGDQFTYATEAGDVVPTGIKYTWTVAEDANIEGESAENTATETMSQTLTNKTNAPIDVVYTVTPAGTCPGAAFTVTVTVNPKAKIGNKTYTICTGNEFPFATNGTTGTGGEDLVPDGTTYSWTVDPNSNVTGQSAQNNKTTVTQTLNNGTATAQTVVYNVTPKSGDCIGDEFKVTVTVSPKAKVANKTYTICSGETFPFATVAADVVPAGTTYSWAKPVNDNVDGQSTQDNKTTVAQTLTNLSNTAQTVVYTVTPKSGDCTGDDFTVTVKVNPKAKIADQTYTICTGEAFPFATNGTTGTGGADLVPAGTTYSWTVDPNSNVTGQSAQNNKATVSQTMNNGTATAQTVVYTVTPKSGDCVGDDFTVTVTVNPKATIAAQTYTICTGDAVPFATATNDVVPAGTKYTWTIATDNANVSGQSAETTTPQDAFAQTLTNATATAQTLTYTVTPMSGTCQGDDFTVKVTVNPKPVITVNPAADVCNNLTVDLAATFSSNVSGSTFAYYTDAAGTSPASVTTAKWNASAPNQAVDQTTTLYAIATANGCPSEIASSSVTIKHKPVAPTVENIRECAAVTPEAREWASLVSNVEANAELKWYNGSAAVTPADFDMSVAMNKAYSVTQTVNGCESDKSMVEVHIKPLPEAPMVTNNVVCEGVGSKAWRDLVTSRVDGGVKTWFSDINGTAQIAEPITISFSKPGERTAYVAIEKDGCLSEVVEVSSSVHATPSFAEVIDESDESTTLRVNGVAPFTYLLDKNIREEFDGEVNLGILSIGNHPLTVSDEIGCKRDTVLRIEPIPLVPDKFFTPNGDGVNDKWTIKGLERYPETKIFLHDRYGKELAEFKAKDFDGWDGKYNGEDMPSTDYWYIIELRETGKRMVGHFLLRR